MICLVDMEYEHAARSSSPGGDAQVRAVPRAYVTAIQRRLKRLSGHPCVVRRYAKVSAGWVETSKIDALILGGNVTEWDRYDRQTLEPLMEVVQSASLPILGICGGLQFIALAHGVTVGPMRELDPGEKDVGAGIGRGYLKEWGFTPLQLVRSDPLFEGLEQPVFLQAHYWEVKSVPEGFTLLASTETCRIQAIRRTGTLAYGVQFHPEAYVDGGSMGNWLLDVVYPEGYTKKQLDGRALLTNFFRLAGLTPPPGRGRPTSA